VKANSQGTHISSGVYLSRAHVNSLTLSGGDFCIGISALANIYVNHMSIDMASSRISAEAFSNTRLDFLDIIDLP
jgi:hypothetical protein